MSKILQPCNAPGILAHRSGTIYSDQCQSWGSVLSVSAIWENKSQNKPMAKEMPEIEFNPLNKKGKKRDPID